MTFAPWADPQITPRHPVDIAIAGSSGMVGQRLLRLCEPLGWIKNIVLLGSDKRVGHTLGDAEWRDGPHVPHRWRDVLFQPMDTACPIVLSCLPNAVADVWEKRWRASGSHVFSNAAAYRLDPQVPLVMPDANVQHMLTQLPQQTEMGKMVCNPNCSVGGMVPLIQLFHRHVGPLTSLSIVTLQSISGAGYPGVPSTDIVGNTIPDIPQETDKIHSELCKMLDLAQDTRISVTVHRVPVTYGHVATLHLRMSTQFCPSDVAGWINDHNQNKAMTFVTHEQRHRPQVLRDLTEHDMRIHVGPVTMDLDARGCHVTLLSHNLVRGAAGALLWNVVTALDHGLLSPEA